MLNFFPPYFFHRVANFFPLPSFKSWARIFFCVSCGLYFRPAAMPLPLTGLVVRGAKQLHPEWEDWGEGQAIQDLQTLSSFSEALPLTSHSYRIHNELVSSSCGQKKLGTFSTGSTSTVEHFPKKILFFNWVLEFCVWCRIENEKDTIERKFHCVSFLLEYIIHLGPTLAQFRFLQAFCLIGFLAGERHKNLLSRIRRVFVLNHATSHNKWTLKMLGTCHTLYKATSRLWEEMWAEIAKKRWLISFHHFCEFC